MPEGGDAPILWTLKDGIEARQQEPRCQVPGKVQRISGRNDHGLCANLEFLTRSQQPSLKSGIGHDGRQGSTVEPNAIGNVVEEKNAVTLDEVRDKFFSLFGKIRAQRDGRWLFAGCNDGYDLARQRLTGRHALAVRAECD